MGRLELKRSHFPKCTDRLVPTCICKMWVMLFGFALKQILIHLLAFDANIFVDRVIEKMHSFYVLIYFVLLLSRYRTTFVEESYLCK